MNHTTPGTTATNATLGRSTEALPASAEHERMRDYCAKLCKTIARYASTDELADLAQLLDSFKGRIIAGRYAPGLNDAVYDLYAAFNFRAPASSKTNDQEQC